MLNKGNSISKVLKEHLTLHRQFVNITLMTLDTLYYLSFDSKIKIMPINGDSPSNNDKTPSVVKQNDLI